ncbi:hypothetical protein Leryth_018850, partial [Lithospermum erythrorhizon]
MAQVMAFNSVGGGLFGVSKFGSIFFLVAIRPLERAVPARPAVNPTAAKRVPLYTSVPKRSKRPNEPGSNIWLVGQVAKIDGRVWMEAVIVGAKRYMRTKFMMDPTTRVEKTKSSSLRPKLGREAMSPITQAVTPTNSSITTLKGNCGSAATLALHPLKKAPTGPKLSQKDDED